MIYLDLMAKAARRQLTGEPVSTIATPVLDESELEVVESGVIPGEEDAGPGKRKNEQPRNSQKAGPDTARG